MPRKKYKLAINVDVKLDADSSVCRLKWMTARPGQGFFYTQGPYLMNTSVNFLHSKVKHLNLTRAGVRATTPWSTTTPCLPFNVSVWLLSVFKTGTTTSLFTVSWQFVASRTRSHAASRDAKRKDLERGRGDRRIKTVTTASLCT